MTREELEKKAREVGVANSRYESRYLGNYVSLDEIQIAFKELESIGCKGISFEAEKYSEDYSDYESVRIVINGTRPATDEELMTAIENQEKTNKERIERDRKQYEELKKRFE